MVRVRRARLQRPSLLLVGFLVLVATVPSGGAEASPSVRLVYARTAEASSCPDEASLRDAVAARFGYDPFFAWARQTVVVLLSRPHGRYVASVQILDEQGIASGARQLSSDSSDCSEIVAATALAVSVALDAAPSPKRPPAPPAPAPGPEPAPSPPDAAPSAPLPSPHPGPLREQAASPAPSLAARLHVAVGVDVLGAFGLVPAMAPGLSVFGRVGERPWSVALELHGDAPESASRPAELGGGRVEARLFAAAIVPCFHLGPVVVCTVGTAGALEAAGLDVRPAHSRTTPFGATGVRLGVEWPLTTRFAVRARGDGLVNLSPATLALGQDGQTSVWSAPRLAGTVGVGLLAQFP
jgi:hypothetical protein